VNQWTLLIGMLPLAYGLSHGQIVPMHMDARQVEEILLTAAQSLFAVMIIANFTFSLTAALALLGLFVSQLFFVSPEIRCVYSFIYLVLALGLAIMNRRNRVSILSVVPRGVRRSIWRRPTPTERHPPSRRAVG